MPLRTPVRLRSGPAPWHTLPDGRCVEFPIDGFAKHCLLEGIDELGYILSQEAAIAAYEAKRVGSINTLG